VYQSLVKKGVDSVNPYFNEINARIYEPGIRITKSNLLIPRADSRQSDYMYNCGIN